MFYRPLPKHTHTHTSLAVATKLHRKTGFFSQSLIQKPKGMASSNVTFLAFFVALALSALHTDAAAAAAAAETLRHRSKTWCVAKPSAEAAALRGNLEFACSESDCGAIQDSGGCAPPDEGLLSQASVAMNSYYQARGRNSWNCFFNGTGLITITDPSLGACKYA